jgi:hypothetical protein
MEMARTWFPDNKDAAQAVVLSMYDMEETMAYAEGQDVNDEEQNVLDVARGGMRLRADLCIELREAPPLSLANPCGRRCYTRTGPPRWEPITKDMLNEVDDEESADFANFEDDEAAPGITDEQWALLTLFESARRDQDGHHLTAAESEALFKRRVAVHHSAPEIGHRGNRATSMAWGSREGEDLRQRAAVAVVREQYQWEARELAAVREAVAVRVAANMYPEAMAEATRVHVAQV